MNHKHRVNRVYLSLGSNTGDRAANLAFALALLSECMEELRVSRFYETRPLLYVRQPAFLNCAASGMFSGLPADLLRRIHRIEHALGRRRGRRYGPRTIDLDILLFGDRIVNGPELVIPHPGMEHRLFVLVPLLELEPGLRNPVTGEYFWKYLDKNHGQGVYFHSFSRYTTRIPLTTAATKDYGRNEISHRPV